VIKHTAQAEMTNHVYESMSSYQIASKIGPDFWMLFISAILSSYIILPNSKTSHPPYLSPVCLFISFAHPQTSLTCPPLHHHYDTQPQNSRHRSDHARRPHSKLDDIPVADQAGRCKSRPPSAPRRGIVALARHLYHTSVRCLGF
jgi:hypothetical protein